MLPEELAREKIDKQLKRAGWDIVSRDEYTPNTTSAVKEALMKGNTESDYLLFIDNKAIAVVEAKREENPLGLEVEKQAEGYAKAPQNWYGLWCDRLIPLVYMANGKKLYFKNMLTDPDGDYIELTEMHSPKKMLQIINEHSEYGALPRLDKRGLRDCQYYAETEFEKALKAGEKKSLAILATGSGKTYLACLASYRLLNYTPIKRILFLVDRNNLARQTEAEFSQFDRTENQQDMSSLYEIKRLKNEGDIKADIVISTIQKLFAVLTGQTIVEGNEDAEDETTTADEEKETKDVVILGEDLKLPKDYFQLIIVDECHRSIYGKWKAVLDYFSSAKVLGLTATPTPEAYAFFNNNIIEEYTYEESVVDGVNVPSRIYRIATEITEHGGAIREGTTITETSRKTGQKTTYTASERVDYEPTQLDRSVINEDQIRKVLVAFKKSIYEDLYPNRDKKWEYVPKTLIFAKDDNHATEIVEAVKDVFADEFDSGNVPVNFVQKITYSSGDSNGLIRDFRTEKDFRIAVTVTLVATGTDVKPLEVVLFMKDVQSDVLYTQMKGRGCRVISDDKLKEVTPNADTKECYYIVDAVGVTEHEKRIPRRVPGGNPKNKIYTLEVLLEHLAHNEVSDENLWLLRDYCSSINARYENNPLFGRHLEYFISIYGFAPRTIAGKIQAATENGFLIEHQYIDPSHDNSQRMKLIADLISNVAARKKLLEMQKGYIAHTEEDPDEIIYAGFSKETAKSYIQFIVYNSWANPEETYGAGISREDGYHVCTALDMVYYLLFMDDVDELYKYLQYSENMKDTHILCIGGDSSNFLMWKEADHLIEKGAIHYSLMNLGFDSENDYVVDYYRTKLRDFPIGRRDYILDNPFAWKITPKDNGFYEYIYKEHVGFGGLFRAFDNGCYFFFPYNSAFFHDTADYIAYRDIIGVLDDIIQRIMTSCNDLICSCESIDYCSIQVMMMPESYAKQIKSGETLLMQERKYIKSDAYISNGKIVIRYIPLSERIFKDLAEAKNREAEVEIFSELLLPLNKYFPQFYNELSEKLTQFKPEKKEVSASSYEIEYTWKIEQESYFRVENEAYLSVKKHIAQVCLSAGIQPGTYYGKNATSVVRKIQQELINDFENEVRQYNYLELYEKALSIYSTLIHEVMIHRKRYESIYDVKESCKDQIAQNIIQLREEAKHNSKVVSYLIETLLFLSQKGSKPISNEHIQYLLAYANWLVVLSENADMCYFTDEEAFVEVSSEYVIDVESKRTDHIAVGNDLAKRMYDNPGYIERDRDADKEYFEKVQVSFEKDTGIPLAIFLSLVFYLETGGKIGSEIFYRGNVLCFYEEDIIKDFCSIQSCPFEIAQKALASICINTNNLKTKNGKTDFYLPIGEKEKRCDRFETKPVYKYDDMIIYSPSVLDYLKNYWENSLFEFRMPYEIGMRNTKETLVNWKRVYEKKIVYDLKDVFTQSGFVTRTNFELQSINKEKYPQSLGDYDVFAINACKKEIWIVECKVIEKVETFYEMYRQQNRFFNEDKEDEKFQRRIDYLREHYSEVLSDLKISAEKYEIKPFMCVNKVFVSRYKEVTFPILSYQELVKEIKKVPSSL